MRKLFILLTAVLLVGCGGRKEQSDTSFSEMTDVVTTAQTAAETVTEADVNRTYIAEGFSYGPIDEKVKNRITGVSYPKSGARIETEELSYIKLLHYDFDGNVKEGELIVNTGLAKEVTEIFYELYKEKYPLTQVRLVDEYGGDDEASMAANNTSAFNYRTVEGSDKLSFHAKGAAIDINPLINPCVTGSRVSPVEGTPYADRSRDFEGKIDENDLAYKLFKEAGWTWGGHWNSLKDYQHFQKEV